MQEIINNQNYRVAKEFIEDVIEDDFTDESINTLISMYNLLTPENAIETYKNADALYESEALKKCDLERKQINKDTKDFIKTLFNDCIIIILLCIWIYFLNSLFLYNFPNNIYYIFINKFTSALSLVSGVLSLLFFTILLII